MVLLSIFFTNQIHGGIISRLFFIHFVAPCACSFIAPVKYYFKSFCMKIWARWHPYIHLSVVFPSRMPARLYFVTQPILLSENILIFDINHQQNTKVRPDWNDKNDNANYAPSCITWKVLQWLRLPFLKKYSIKCEKDLDCELLFYSELKRHNVSHYIYYLATDNIHIVLENDNTVLIKGL